MAKKTFPDHLVLNQPKRRLQLIQEFYEKHHQNRDIHDAKDLAKTLKKDGVTLDIQYKGKLVLRLGEKAKPKLSKIITMSSDIEITNIKALRSLEKGI